jgi:hypothetical protein
LQTIVQIGTTQSLSLVVNRGSGNSAGVADGEKKNSANNLGTDTKVAPLVLTNY